MNNTYENTMIEIPAVDCWEDLIGMLPEIPKEISRTATMEICEVKTIWTPRPKTVKKTEQKKAERKPETKTMTLQEYYAECEKKQAAMANPQVAKPKKRRNNKNTKGWETVKKDEPEHSEIMTPRGWTKNLYRQTGTPKTNTTLILKSLPFDGVSDKDLNRFFKKHAGPVRFVNVLKNDEGKCKGIAFIRFETKEGSDRGLTLNNFFYEGRRVYVDYAEDRRK